MNYNSISNFIQEIDKDLEEINNHLISLNSIDNLKDLINVDIISFNSFFFSFLTLKRSLIKNKKNHFLKNKITNIFTAIQPDQVIYLNDNLKHKVLSMIDKFIELDNDYDLSMLFTFLVINNYEKETMKLGKHFIQTKNKKMIKLFLDFLISKKSISNYLKVKKIYQNL